MNGDSQPNYKPVKMLFDRGAWSSKDAGLLPPNALAEGVNISITNDYGASKCAGRQKYNTTETGSSVAIKGMFTFIGEDGVEYIIKACNSKLYWSNGNGSFTAIKYANEAVDITINTTSYWYNFILFDKTISATLKKVVYVISNAYPVSTNSNGTANTKCTTSKALRLQVSSSVIVGYNIYYGSGGGTDDVAVGDGTAATVSWPQSGQVGGKLLNRVIVGNYAGATNGWIASEAASSENWTNSSVSSNTGGGTSPREFNAYCEVDTRGFFFSRDGIMVINAAPGPITSWREYYVPTKLGNVGRQVALHSDGWVYYVSPEGPARTNGSIAERVDFDIEDQTSTLSQLIQNLYSVNINSTSAFDAGLPTSGDNLLDTASATLKQKQWDTKAEWDTCTLTNIDTASAVYTNTAILSKDGSLYYATGNLITPAIDYGATPTSIGSLTARITLPILTGMQFLVATSADNVTYSSYTLVYDAVYGTAPDQITVVLSSIPITPARYIKIKVTFAANAAKTLTPVLHNLMIGGQWISAIQDLTVTPAGWSVFSAIAVTNTQTITYEMDTSSVSNFSSSDGYVAIPNGQVPSNTLRRYIRFRVTFNSTDDTQVPYINGITLNYFRGSAGSNLPTVYSHKDRLYFAFMSNGGSANDHAWIGETKPLQGLGYTASALSQVIYPIWTKRDFVTANCFSTYGGNLISGSSTAGFVYYEETGNTNAGAAFTSYFYTSAINLEDVRTLLRFFYLHYKSNSSFSVYWRTRSADEDWSAWSTALTIAAAPRASRSVKEVPPAVVSGDYIQLRIETTVTDDNWSIDYLNAYISAFAKGR